MDCNRRNATCHDILNNVLLKVCRLRNAQKKNWMLHFGGCKSCISKQLYCISQGPILDKLVALKTYWMLHFGGCKRCIFQCFKCKVCNLQNAMFLFFKSISEVAILEKHVAFKNHCMLHFWGCKTLR